MKAERGFVTCADGVLDGRALVQRHLVVTAHGTERAAERRAQHGAERSGRTLAADGVVAVRAGSRRAPTVLAQVAGPTLDQLLRFGAQQSVRVSPRLSVSVVAHQVHGGLRLRTGRRIRRVVGRRVLVKVALALALRVATGVALVAHVAVGRTAPTRLARFRPSARAPILAIDASFAIRQRCRVRARSHQTSSGRALDCTTCCRFHNDSNTRRYFGWS